MSVMLANAVPYVSRADDEPTLRISGTAVRFCARSVSRVSARYARWQQVRSTRNALAGLSDRELCDIGLNRYDLASIDRRI